MGPRWIQFCLACCLALGALSQNDEFPALEDLFGAFYQTEVQMTNVLQDTNAYATEYFYQMEKMGRLDTLILGNKASVYYYNASDEVLEVNRSRCLAWNTDESQYTLSGVFTGWLIKEPMLVIGPSALLWQGINRKKEVKYAGSERVRDIPCRKFSLPVLNDNDNYTIDYYFAPENWTTPYQYMNKRTGKYLTVPVRVRISGQTTKDVADKQILFVDQINDFIYFKNFPDDWLVFQPPVGVGCKLRKKTDEMPDIPDIFTFSAEIYDLYKAENEEDETDVEYETVWYNKQKKMARLDYYSKKEYFSELYDFTTGTTYSIKNGRSCTMKGLRDSNFEGFDNKFIGHMKEPGEVLNLKGNFYEMGKRRMRGMKCDTYETVQEGVSFGGNDYDRLVITVYYTETPMRVGVDSEMEDTIPVYYLITGWNDTTGKVTYKTQVNVVGFDDVVGHSIYSTFGVERCYPQEENKAYFILFFGAKGDAAAQMEKLDKQVIEEVRTLVIQYANISELRLPMIKADYKTTGVYVTGLMLDRPPILIQFIQMDKTPTSHVANRDDISLSWSALGAKTAEDCAVSCIDQERFTCKGFFFCGANCYLKTIDVLTPVQDDQKFDMGLCIEYLRDVQESNNSKNAPLAKALDSLKAAVMNGSITLSFKIKDGTESVSALEIVIGEGPNSDQDQGKSYTKVINNVKFDAKDENVDTVKYVDNVNDCFKNCKNSESLECSSFSFCPGRRQECLISSNLITDRVQGYKYTVDATGCTVYSINYLDYFEAMRGRVPLLGGEDVIENVASPEECAKNCRVAKKFTCRSFEFCRFQKSCVLHAKHVLDLPPGQISTRSNPCSHYSARFTADYLDTGFTLIDDSRDKRNQLTLEQCARVCSEELKGKCKSFNFCPASAPYAGDSTCALSSSLLRDPKVTTTEDGRCRHYEKKTAVDDWNNLKKSQSPSGYTQAGFSWLVVGMLFLGLVIGALGFVLYSYMRSRSGTSDSTVRFVKQDA